MGNICRPIGQVVGPQEDLCEEHHGEDMSCPLSQKLSCFERGDSFELGGSEVSTPGPRSMGGYVPVTPLSSTSYDNSRYIEDLDGPHGRFLTDCREDNLGETVELHLYDLNDTFGHMNSVSLDLLNFGGALHVGVDVLGNEWSFGMQGVSVSCPKENQYYSYRRTVSMGRTMLKRKEVECAILLLKRRWSSIKYDIFTRNCGHFCNELCDSLGVGRMPGWVTRLAETLGELPGAPALAKVIENATIDKDALPGSPVQFESDYEDQSPCPGGLRQPGPMLPSASPVRCRLGAIDGADLPGNGPMPRARCEAFRVNERNQRSTQRNVGGGGGADKYGGRLQPRQIMFNAATGGA
ncbi:unnamed protein product [Polarella glacialis]|uniref:PPPDE domain-containing protein n=1 Tax=Polarella glacialis TaxID=89957 RepID=A0A813K521_POLGL|nr:unnamed protein product [Polarella glacialis]|mmetsp:Transcript_77583/g.140005  ORF Transcript_77583/g.140005 Transcript_77583/m.140005 type:complete len:352 (+) Transcript_77583:145-1200(+)